MYDNNHVWFADGVRLTRVTYERADPDLLTVVMNLQTLFPYAASIMANNTKVSKLSSGNITYLFHGIRAGREEQISKEHPHTIF